MEWYKKPLFSNFSGNFYLKLHQWLNTSTFSTLETWSTSLYEVTGGCRGRFSGKNLLVLQVWWNSLNIQLILLDPHPSPCRSYSSGLFEVTGGCRGRLKVKIYLPFKSGGNRKIWLILLDLPPLAHVNQALLASMRSLEAAKAVFGFRGKKLTTCPSSLVEILKN